mmetsp:Transcript_6412/g.18065  ORF Transcript_6412/g.18065 Transcript_6412/m.18065 type:complete len:217 (+) Transcript_6412:165-815(+)
MLSWHNTTAYNSPCKVAPRPFPEPNEPKKPPFPLSWCPTLKFWHSPSRSKPRVPSNSSSIHPLYNPTKSMPGRPFPSKRRRSGLKFRDPWPTRRPGGNKPTKRATRCPYCRGRWTRICTRREEALVPPFCTRRTVRCRPFTLPFGNCRRRPLTILSSMWIIFPTNRRWKATRPWPHCGKILFRKSIILKSWQARYFEPKTTRRFTMMLSESVRHRR